jgi:hypothetical protein
MEIVLLYIAASFVVAVGASSRNRSGLGYFVLSLLISPVLAFLLLMLMPPKPEQRFDAAPDVRPEPRLDDPDRHHGESLHRVPERGLKHS